MHDPNYPRPQFHRPDWKSLDGTWSYSFSDSDDPAKVPWQGWIKVPFPPESPLSGVKDPDYHPVIWYQRRFEVPDSWANQRVLLHFGAVDYAAEVWVNGRFVIRNEGGHTPFSADVTDVLVEGEQILTLRVEDDPLDMEKPRGKQDWEPKPHVIWYPRTTGIWQPVWIEPVRPTRIASLRLTPDLDRFALEISISLAGDVEDLVLDVQVSLEGQPLAEDSWRVIGQEATRRIHLPDPGVDNARKSLMWSPEHPNLLDLAIALREGDQVLDRVESYAALRSVEVHDGAFYLNGRPYFLQMVLDQGYWPDSHLAPPGTDALKRDVELAKSFGFNGVRKHQKIEDPRYFYWADRLGLLVWAEMPSFYRFSPRAARRMVRELMRAIERDYNHPSIVAWVPLNESWGLPDLHTRAEQRQLVRALYHLAKTLDPTRPVIDNDGWEHLCTDIFTIHDYLNDPELFARRYGSIQALQTTLTRRPVGRDLTLEGCSGDGLPVVLSEFGGIRLRQGEGWGYGEASSPEEFLRLFAGLIESVSQSALAGYCYTQLTDTFQEQTGLAHADRRPKVEPEAIAHLLRSALRRRTAAEV